MTEMTKMKRLHHPPHTTINLVANSLIYNDEVIIIYEVVMNLVKIGYCSQGYESYGKDTQNISLL